ncbi:MAG: DUF2452 domain-containing protein [Halioglobus sp.]|nr:DUF2452 domain-containing protein [Halioglobus sp.]
MKSNPNPQGKGVVPVLRDWNNTRPAGSTRKNPAQFLRDYCISSLVLAARFKFRPVVERTYYLYAGDTQWTLSLIGPQEWHHGAPGRFLAPCRLRPDMTWELDAQEFSDESAIASLQRFVEGFVTTLQGQESIAAELPFYAAHLSYYQRMLATGLASSLASSGADTAQVRALAASGRALLGVKEDRA